MKLIGLLPTLLTGLLAWNISLMPVHGQFKPPNLGIPRTTAGGGSRFVPPKLDDFGQPTTAGGASRSGICLQEKTRLRVLIPSSQMGLTLEPRPTFFLYLPKSPVPVGEFVLKDSDERDIYRTEVNLANQQGVVSFQLPATAPALELNKNYQWYFHVICQPSDRLRDAFVTAWVRRIQPSPVLAKTLQQVNPRQHPDIYAQAGIWQDTLTTLTQLRQTRPNDQTVIADWQSILDSVGLGKIPGGPPSPQQNLQLIPPSPSSQQL